MARLDTLISELRRRRVIHAAGLYVVGAWLLVQVADVFMPTFGLPSAAMQYLFYGAILGFPLAMVFAWMYNITSRGLVRTRPYRHGDKVDFELHWFDYVVLAMLAIVAAVIVSNLVANVAELKLGSDSKPDVSAIPFRSVAVLPFKFISGSPAHQYLGEGVAEELLNTLGSFRTLRVAARTSSFSFKDQSTSAKVVAAELGVRTLLEGAVSVSEDTVRVTVRLINAADGYQLWGRTYDRRLDAENLFQIQNDIAADIARTLDSTLTEGDFHKQAEIPTRDLDAYRAYLLGKQAMAKRTLPALEAALEYFRAALDEDEGFAQAHIGIADGYSILQSWGYISRREAIPYIRTHTNAALAIDDTLSDAYVSLASLNELEIDFDAAVSNYERALAINPNNETAHSWYGLFLLWRLGQWEDALNHSEKALNLDRLSPHFRMNVAVALSALGRFDEAIAEYRKCIEVDPDYGYPYKVIGDNFAAAYGRMNEAIRWYLRSIAVEPDPDWIAHIADAYLTLGDAALAEEWIRIARRYGANHVFLGLHEALLNTFRGRHEVAADGARLYLEAPLDNVSTTYALFILRNADLDAQNYEAARKRYERIFPALAEGQPVVHRSNYRGALDLSLVLRRMGEADRADLLVDGVLSMLATMPRLGVFGYGIADSEILAMQGRKSESLAALRAAIDEGWRMNWYFWTEFNPHLDSIRDSSDYEQIISIVRSDMAQQLAVSQREAKMPD